VPILTIYMTIMMVSNHTVKSTACIRIFGNERLLSPFYAIGQRKRNLVIGVIHNVQHIQII